MNIVILAAGMGKRMRSDLPKVLHRLAGRPLLAHVLDTARFLEPTRIVVVHGHGGALVREAFADATDLDWVLQEPQLGTGHAVMQALPHLDDGAPTLVLSGDVPLTRPATLARLVGAAGPGGMALLTVLLDDPKGYGRILRRGGAIVGIVEEKDASAEERAIREVNSGIMILPTAHLRRWLDRLSNRNAQGEYYLTDVIGFAAADGIAIGSTEPDSVAETLGVNSKAQLADLERRYQLQVAAGLLEAGVTLADPARIDVRGALACGKDVSIDVGCIFGGTVTVGDGARIGPYCVVRDSHIGPDTVLEAYSHVEGAAIGARARIGPYARLRPGAALADEVHVGNFVEVKNSEMAAGSKANHLAYLGDATIGARVNVGAGTITCNYDGANKHRTVIEDDVHIGSDTQLVAPVRIGAGATIGAGTTVWRDVPAGTLVVNDKTQVAKPGYVRPVKKAR